MTMTKQESIQITVEDIATALRFIHIASTRGAYKLEEYIDVGNCYSKLYNFLQENNVIEPNAQTTES